MELLGGARSKHRRKVIEYPARAVSAQKDSDASIGGLSGGTLTNSSSVSTTISLLDDRDAPSSYREASDEWGHFVDISDEQVHSRGVIESVCAFHGGSTSMGLKRCSNRML